MIEFLRRRRLRKAALHALRHAKHVRNMQEDIMSDSTIEEILRLEKEVRSARDSGRSEAIEATCDALHEALSRARPPRSFPVIREYVELIAVALAVALGFRAYFIQPFKIPTGSMQPTLYGITSWQQPKRRVMDHLPLKVLKWATTGQWYREVVVKAPGHVKGPTSAGKYNQWDVVFEIAGRTYKVPKDAFLRSELEFTSGDYMHKGDVLWAGVMKAGDHVFVDKVRWNFRRPRRGGVSVFATDGIEGLPAGTHYIKRMIGLPGDTVSIDEPNVLIDGQVLTEPIGVARVASAKGNYAGYTWAQNFQSPRDSIRLGAAQYFALGDNTVNSRDGRFWGYVPQENLTGPAAILYWPLFRDGRLQFGLIR
jgi:signal peptidase I